jgi:PAS domain S-box-containing protein
MIDKIKNEDLRRLFSLSPEMFSISGYDGFFRALSPAWETTSGFSIEELLSKPFIDLVHPEDLEQTKAEIFKITEGGKITSFVNRCLCKDGSYKWFLWSAVSYPEEGIIYAAARDVTNHKTIEHSLRESEAKFRLIVEGSEDIFFYKANTERILEYISPSVKNVTGYSPFELLNKTYKDFLYRDESGNIVDSDIIPEISLERKSKNRYQMHFRHKDGRQIILEMTESPSIDSQGGSHIMGFANDITDRIQAEDALRENQRRMTTLMNSFPGMAYRIRMSTDWIMEYVSEGCYQLTGYFPDELIQIYNISFGNLTYYEDRGLVYEAVKNALEKKEPFKVSYRINTAKAIVKWVWEQGQGIYNEDGTLQAIEGFITDITEYKKAEAEQGRLNRALKAISQVNQIIIRSSDENSLLEEVCQIICNIDGYQMAWVGKMQYDSDKTILPVAWKGKEDGYLKHVKLSWGNNYLGQGPTGICIRSKRPSIMHDVEKDMPTPMLKQAAKERGYASIFCAPLMQNDIAFGVLAIYANRKDIFTTAEKELLEQLTNDLSFGICSLRSQIARKKAEDSLRESENRYRVLVESSPIGIGIQRNYKWLYVNPAAVRIFNASSADEVKDKPVNSFGNLPEEEKKLILQRIDRIKAGQILQPYEFNAVFPDGREETVQVYSVRIIYEGESAILTLLKDVTEQKLAERRLEKSREELRNLAAHLQAAREEERACIAREIHDELGQFLTGLKIDASFLEDIVNEQIEKSASLALLEKIHSMSELIDTTVKSVRRIASELRPVILDSMGLLAAIEWLADDFQNRTGTSCQCFLTVQEINLSKETSTAVFRILQEALTNVMRHAGASKVTISLIEESPGYCLEIKDNGKGIKEEDQKKAKSFGLIGMKERAHLFGGNAEIESLPGKGTTIIVTIPLNN